MVSQLHSIAPVADFTLTIDNGATYTADHTLTTVLITPTGATGVIFYTDLPLLPEGTVCDITELDETPEWTLTSDRTVTLTATTSNPVTAEFVNERVVSPLEINKLVEGPTGFDLEDEAFEVTVTCSNGFTTDPYVLTGTIGDSAPWVIEDLPYGAECGVVETPDARFTTTQSTDAVAIENVGAEVEILNQTGSLHVDIETLVSDLRPFDPDDDFTFTITCSNADGVVFEETISSATEDGFARWDAPLLPTGATCETTFDPLVGWNFVQAMGETIADNVVTQTIGTDIAWNAFEVERELASLSVTKLLEEIPFDADFSTEDFEIFVTCADGFIEPDHQLSEFLSVSSVSPLTVENLPVNSECTVAEVENPFFNPSFSPDATFIVSSEATDNAINAIAVTNIGTQALSTFIEEQRPATEQPPILAFTGRTVWSLVSFALLLMAAGIFLVFNRRRRDESQV